MTSLLTLSPCRECHNRDGLRERRVAAMSPEADGGCQSVLCVRVVPTECRRRHSDWEKWNSHLIISNYPGSAPPHCARFMRGLWAPGAARPRPPPSPAPLPPSGDATLDPATVEHRAASYIMWLCALRCALHAVQRTMILLTSVAAAVICERMSRCLPICASRDQVSAPG